MKAKIFDITRCSLHDGNGIRTVVYLKGCNLKCQWCHNPEGISLKNEVLHQESRCIKCGRCVKICPDHHIISKNVVIYKREKCSNCMKCVQACPNEALSACGKDMTVEEVFSEILKDIHYYEVTGGGVTFSGGECLLYPKFLLEILKRCKNAGINTAVETALNVKWNSIELVRNYIDTLIIDIKHYDNEIHKRLTGSGNQLIINNIRRISHLHSSILIRIPIIPMLNDGDENLIGTAKLINTFGGGIKTIELLKYNNLAGNKYTALGRKNLNIEYYPQDDDFMKQKGELIEEYVKADIVVC